MATTFNDKALARLSAYPEQTRTNVISGVEYFLQRPLSDIQPHEEDFAMRQIEIYLQIETGGEFSTDPTLTAEFCNSCGDEGLINENGCYRCVFCGYAKCDL